MIVVLQTPNEDFVAAFNIAEFRIPLKVICWGTRVFVHKPEETSPLFGGRTALVYEEDFIYYITEQNSEYDSEGNPT